MHELVLECWNFCSFNCCKQISSYISDINKLLVKLIIFLNRLFRLFYVNLFMIHLSSSHTSFHLIIATLLMFQYIHFFYSTRNKIERYFWCARALSMAQNASGSVIYISWMQGICYGRWRVHRDISIVCQSDVTLKIFHSL